MKRRTWRIDAGSKWPSVQRRHFQVHSREWKFSNYEENFIELIEPCSFGSNWQYGNIVSDDGLTPNSRQAILIIWTNVGMFYWRMYAALGLNGLNQSPCPPVELPVYLWFTLKSKTTLKVKIASPPWGNPSVTGVTVKPVV